MIYEVPHYIDGKAVVSVTNNTRSIFNPAEGKQIGQVYFASTAICESAIEAAQQAWSNWASMPVVQRARILFKFKALLEQYTADLAHIVTKEHGKTLDDAKGSVARAIEVVEFYCGLVSQLAEKFSANVTTGIDCYTLRQPLGVCVGITPFNFPVMVPVWMMIPAIACGNTFILKPSEQDPSAAIRLLELLTEAGLPAGVANCLQGDQQVVEQLVSHPAVAAVSAVASTPVAEAIYTKAINFGKRAHTFGGAKNHCVVMPDAPLEQTAQAIVGAAFGSAGQRCMAISAVVAVGEGTADKLLAKLTPLIKAIKIGAGADPTTDMGPVISMASKTRIIAAIEQGVTEGAQLLIDGRKFHHKDYPDGYFLGPSLFDQVNESMFIYQTEIFGPVLILLRVADFDEAVLLINRNQYGNGTAIFTRDGYTAREFSRRVQVGMIGVNIPIPVPIASHPFGGWKKSVFGDTNMHGAESMHFYTRLKTITSKWPTSELSASNFAMPIH